MIILGIDPGSRITGYGVIKYQGNQPTYIDSGCIRPPATADVATRLKVIFEGVDRLIATYRPHHFSIEQVFMHKNPDSALKLGQARGVAICAASLADVLVFEYSATQIKKTVVGSGHADKMQVSHMVRHALKLVGTPQVDAGDALAAALCHAQHWHNPILQKARLI